MSNLREGVPVFGTGYVGGNSAATTYIPPASPAVVSNSLSGCGSTCIIGIIAGSVGGAVVLVRD